MAALNLSTYLAMSPLSVENKLALKALPCWGGIYTSLKAFPD